jgi:hypothetical protein
LAFVLFGPIVREEKLDASSNYLRIAKGDLVILL